MMRDGENFRCQGPKNSRPKGRLSEGGGDQLRTLVTCAYHTTNSRGVVAARRSQE